MKVINTEEFAKIKDNCVVTERGCWEWQSTQRKGHRQKWYLGKNWPVHRLMYFLAKGEIDDLYVLHNCDNPPCCNPDHLRLGTNSDNQRDRHERTPFTNYKKTHCHEGHEFTAENTFLSGRTKCCKICRGSHAGPPRIFRPKNAELNRDRQFSNDFLGEVRKKAWLAKQQNKLAG